MARFNWITPFKGDSNDMQELLKVTENELLFEEFMEPMESLDGLNLE